jgi:hypothetical protein
LWLHPEPLRTNAAECPYRARQAHSGIRVLGIELSDDSGGRCDNAYLAKPRGRLSVTAVNINVCDRGELPNVRALAAIHFERARRRAKPNDHGVDILPNELIPQARNYFLTRRRTATQRGAERHDRQNSHIGFPSLPDGNISQLERAGKANFA